MKWSQYLQNSKIILFFYSTISDIKIQPFTVSCDAVSQQPHHLCCVQVSVWCKGQYIKHCKNVYKIAMQKNYSKQNLKDYRTLKYTTKCEID